MISRDAFFAAVRASLFEGEMRQSQVDGCNVILDTWEKNRPASDRRHIAYTLATAYHETARTMQPIREYGEGRSRAYGSETGQWRQAYYGRGFVQLTWQKNYAHATARLRALGLIGADIDLECDADLALRPDLAGAILVFGCIEGWFTSRRLTDYFGAASDWVQARRIVNGLDCAEAIAGYGRAFLAALTSTAD